MSVTVNGLDELKKLGARLEGAARAQVGDDSSPGAAQHLAAVDQWASCLDRDDYQFTRSDKSDPRRGDCRP